VIAAGGKLIDIARESNLPVYILDPKFNPSSQPRFAVGYSIGAIFGVLSGCGVVSENDNHIREVVDFLKLEKGEFQTKAEELAGLIQGKAPILVASEHLLGAAHVAKNQLNESAKSFSALFDIPELNHHLMEGLKNPVDVTSKLLFIFFNSALYQERIQKRYPLTLEVVEKNNVATYEYTLAGDNKLKQVFEFIQLGSYMQMYLGGLYGEDPIAIPWVDYFKEKLA
jgi:glucose/mannose-6-phosphate isomerase